MRACGILLLAFVTLPSGIAGAAAPAATKLGFHSVDAEAYPNLFVWTDTCNVYVLRTGDRAILIDLGDGSVLNHLRELGVEHVDAVLLTDHHREQCQGIERLDREKTAVLAPQAEQELLENPRSFRKWYPSLSDKYSVYGASYVRPPQKPIPLSKTLESNQELELNGWEIRCLSTPGHSPGGMTYLVTSGQRTLAFTGGVVHDGAKMTNWYDTEWDYGFAMGIDTLLASVDTLLGEKLAVVLPAQGPAIKNPREQLQTYREKLVAFRASYIRGYPVFKTSEQDSDSYSKPTAVPLLSQVTPHLYKLSHKTKGKNFAIIVADSGHGLVLDCGLFPKTMLDEIVLGLREHMGLKQIDAFWISHMHGDHFLLGPTLKEKYGAKAWTLESIVDKCEHPRRYDYSALVSAYGDGFDGMQIDKGFRDGETIEWEGYQIQVDWMPGQTEFGCCLWLELDGKRIAFTGDNLFGNAADVKQNGHEAVVARNSAILEEGYIYGSKYLKDLQPDIVMGSHSFVMDDPAAFLGRYHKWSKEMLAMYQDLLPDEQYEYLYDPYWVSAYPYRVDFSERTTQPVTITVRNFRDAPQKHRVELKLPPGVTAKPAVLEGTVESKSRQGYEVELTIDPRQFPTGVQMVPLDITLDGKHYGELFDFLMQAKSE
jgi:glyoxylase-like metal-dependent hydrolase (beta-lactamase superfamily II)